MSNEFDEFWGEAVSFLRSLYEVNGVSPSPAIRSVLGDQRPTIKQLLDTLEEHKDLEVVKRFVERNGDFLDSAEKIDSQSVASRYVSASYDDLKFENLEIVSLFERVKKLPLSQIEHQIAELLSDALGVPVKVDVERLSSEWGNNFKLGLLVHEVSETMKF